MNALVEKFIKDGQESFMAVEPDNEEFVRMVVAIDSDEYLHVDGELGHCLVAVFVQSGKKDQNGNQHFVDLISEVMGRSPLLRCSYRGEEITSCALMQQAAKLADVHCDFWEWNTASPEYFLRQRMNDTQNGLYQQYLKAEIFYQGKKAADFIDQKLTERYTELGKEHELFAGVYGLDPVDLDVPTLEEFNDTGLWVNYHLVATSKRNLTEDDLKADYIKRMVCRRHSIWMSEPSSDRRLQADKQFDKWNNFYLRHCSRHSETWQRELYRTCRDNGDLDRFAPKGDWRKSRC